MKNQQECPDRSDVAAATAEPPASLSVFTAAERDRLERLRRRVIAGERSDSYPIDRRQEFIRWLVEQGKLSDN